MRLALLTSGLLAAAPPLTTSLKIASSLQWIEHTPQPYAIANFYNGSTNSPASLVSGGVFNLAQDPTVDLAANAETQGLRVLATHPDTRLIYVLCEAEYRLVANRASGIETLADLQGKRIGTMRGTSAQYFVAALLATAGLAEEEDYTLVAGGACMRAPCAENTFPAMLAAGDVDAFGLWEPAAALSIAELGEDETVVFQDAGVYREVYSLYTTAAKLADEDTRRDIVAFVRALNRTLDVFSNDPGSVYGFVAEAVGMDPPVVEEVWPVHKWTGTWDRESLLEFLAEEDRWLAGQEGRDPVPEEALAAFLDESIIAELGL